MAKPKNEVFLATFLGEFVEILSEIQHPRTKLPLVVHAYLLDVDDDYYFVGDSPIEVNAAVKKNEVKFIEILRTKDPAVELLEDMPTPETEEETN